MIFLFHSFNYSCRWYIQNMHPGYKRVFFLLLTLQACAPVPKVIESYDNQQKKIVEMVSKSGVKERIEYYRNGNIKNIYTISGKNRHGKYSGFHKNEILAVSGKYKSGNRQGKWIWFSSTGQKDSLRTYANGDLNGDWQNYSGGNTILRRRYKQGRMNGKYREYYADGLLKTKGSYRRDLPENEWIWLSEQGQKQRLINFSGGSKTGKVKIWNKTGEKVLQGRFNNDEREGIWKWYRSSGGLDSMVTYSEGIPHGSFKTWYNNNQPAARGEFKRGVEQGQWKWWSKGGVLDSLKTFNNGRLDGLIQIYYRNGRLALSQIYSDSILQGVSESYFSSGLLNSKTSYKSGRKDGPFEIWTPAGKMEEIGSYDSGRAEGELKRWYSTGIPSSTANYYKGSLHGLMRIYSPSNVIKKEIYYQYGLEFIQFRYHDNKRLKSISIIIDNQTAYKQEWNELGLEITRAVYIDGTHRKTESYLSGHTRYECLFKGLEKHGMERWMYENRKPEKLNLYYEGKLLLTRIWTAENDISEDQVFPY